MGGLGEIQNPEYSRPWHLWLKMSWPLGSIWMADVGAVGLPRGSNQSTVVRLGAWYLPMESFLLAWSCIADPGEVI